jgi:hypothetical protein
MTTAIGDNMRKLWKIKRSVDTSKEKPTMRLIVRRWLVLVTASLGLYLGLPVCGLAQNDQGQNDQGPGIKLGVPNGTYVFTITGYLAAPAIPSNNQVPLAAAGRETYFANGTTSGVTTFSIGGQVQSRVTFAGAFTVNADGSVSETDTQTSGPGQVLHFDVYPTPDGNTLTTIQRDLGATATGFLTRGR